MLPILIVIRQLLTATMIAFQVLLLIFLGSGNLFEQNKGILDETFLAPGIERVLLVGFTVLVILRFIFSVAMRFRRLSAAPFSQSSFEVDMPGSSSPARQLGNILLVLDIPLILFQLFIGWLYLPAKGLTAQSPNGRFVAYYMPLRRCRSHGGLLLVRPKGGIWVRGLARITDVPDWQPSRLHFSPDASVVALEAVNRTGPDGNASLLILRDIKCGLTFQGRREGDNYLSADKMMEYLKSPGKFRPQYEKIVDPGLVAPLPTRKDEPYRDPLLIK